MSLSLDLKVKRERVAV